MTSVIDNDVLIKLCRYALLATPELEAITGPATPGILGAARFVIPKRLAQDTPEPSRAQALAEFAQFLARAERLEPTADEVRYAIALEDAAQRAGLALDTGESQLAAMFVLRSYDKFITGDKRALTALERLLDFNEKLAYLIGKTLCFEQVILTLIDRIGFSICRARVCADLGADKTMKICFSCSQESMRQTQVESGLQSYITDVRSTCPRLFTVLT